LFFSLVLREKKLENRNNLLFFIFDFVYVMSIYASSKRPAGSGCAMGFSFQRSSHSSDIWQQKSRFLEAAASR